MTIPLLDQCLDELTADLRRFTRATGLPAWLEDPRGGVLTGTPGPGQRCERALEAGGTILGALVVGDGGTRADIGILLDDLHGLMARTLDHEAIVSDFIQTTAWQWKEINFLLDVSQNLELSLTEIEACEAVLQRAVRLLGASRATIFLRDPDGLLAMAAAHGVDPELRRTTRLKPDEGVAGWVFSNAAALLAESEADLPPGVWLAPGAEAEAAGECAVLSLPLMSAPLSGRDGVLGVITMCGRGGGVFTSEDLKLLQTAASQAAVAVHNTQLVAQVKQAETLRREMEMAAAIQARLLPQTHPHVPGLEMAGWYRPATVVGGDYYDFIPAGNDGVYYLVADISGHGLASALFMSNARSATRALLRTGTSPAVLAEALNERICEDSGDSGMFLTAVLGHYDARRHSTVLSICGHTTPIVVRADGTIVTPEGGAPPIGMLPTLEAEEARVDLAPGDLLFLYTDGLIESRSARGEMFGPGRVVTLLRQRRAEPLASIAAALYDAVREFADGADLEDDLTMVLLRRTPEDARGRQGRD